MPEEAVIDVPVAPPEAPAEPAAPETPPEPAIPPAPPAEPPPVDPNDPMAALQAAMDAQLGKDEPVAPPAAGEPAAIPEAFQQALAISPYVQTPEHLQQAVAAADEVWKVASGQAPAAGLLEGMRAANPQGYQKVIGDLIPYIEQVTGRKFTDQPAQPPDPNQARLDALESRFAAEEQARQSEQWNQQVTAARGKAMEFLSASAKGTAFEGIENTILQMSANKVGVPEQEMVQMLLQGKTGPLEKAFKEVKAELGGLVRRINANMIKQHRALAGGVPAVKGSQRVRPAPDEMKALPGETTAQTVKRLLQG